MDEPENSSDPDGVAGRPDPAINETKESVASLQRAMQQIEAGQQKLGDQVSQIQRTVAADQEQRKSLSDQVGALGARVDTLASAQAAAAAPTETPHQAPQLQNNRRGRK